MKTTLAHRRPTIKGISEVSFPTIKAVHLDNGIPVYLLEGGDQAILKVEVAIMAGRPYEAKRLAATSYGSLLKEGSGQYSSLQIAETFDHLGATLSQPFSFDFVSLQAYSLAKHFSQMLPVLCSILKDPIFPKPELSLFKQRVRQKLAVDLTQNEIIAYRKATELYFGSSHPYGYNSDEQLYEAITREDLMSHHERLVGPQSITLFVSGRPPSNLIELLQRQLGQWNKDIQNISPRLPRAYPAPTKFQDQLDKSQSAIRIGRRLFDNRHQDYAAMLLLSTILGGYFGSRLMKNLREDHGYTYGAHTHIEDLKHDGYLSINLETDHQHCKKVLQEIDHEIHVLQSELVPSHELEMVKTYICGHLLSKMDGPIQSMSVIKKNILYATDPVHINNLIKKLQLVDAQEVLDVARKYLQKEQLTEVIIH